MQIFGSKSMPVPSEIESTKIQPIAVEKILPAFSRS